MESNHRIHGIDLIRTVSFFAIATFHISFIHYFSPAIDIASQSIVIKVVETSARVLSFSGFTIVFLASFLCAFSRLSLMHKLALFGALFTGWVFLCLLFFENSETFFVWDVYPLMFIGVFVSLFSEKVSTVGPRVMAIIGAMLLWVPIWDLHLNLGWQQDIQNALGINPCSPVQFEWPVFPWIGLVWLGYGVGKEVQNRPSLRGQTLSIRELALWSVPLTLSISQWGGFFNIRLGEFFTCDAYRQPPVVFWSHFVWVLFALRLSFDKRVQSWLAGFRVVRWISTLAINRRFWMAYVLQIALAFVLSWMVRESGVEGSSLNATTIAFIAVFFLPMIEVVTRSVETLLDWLKESLRD